MRSACDADNPAALLCNHLRQHSASTQKRLLQIDLQHTPPDSRAYFLNGSLIIGNASIVYQEINRAKLPDC